MTRASGEAARKAAAGLWAYEHAQKVDRYRGPAKRALAVVCFNREVREFLAATDPVALRQCQQALTGTDYTDYLGRVDDKGNELPPA